MKLLIILSFLLLYACNSVKKEDIAGLWQLEELKIDAMERKFKPTFVEMRLNNSFSISRTAGDLSGLYEVKSERLITRSEDKLWFNTSWKLKRSADKLYLKGKDLLLRNTELIFKRIEAVPDFNELEDRLLGEWELYKIRKGTKVERLKNTSFTLKKDGLYEMRNVHEVIEKGSIFINTRHKKLFFEDTETEWSFRFYGSELRLEHDKKNIKYCLRKHQAEKGLATGD